MTLPNVLIARMGLIRANSRISRGIRATGPSASARVPATRREAATAGQLKR